MTTISQDIRGALQTQLAAVVGIPHIVYEGVAYTPVIGTPYVEPIIVFASGRPATMGDAYLILHQGSLEVSVVYPASSGLGAAEIMADTILAAFPNGTVLTQGTTTVRLRYAERRMALVETNWNRVPLSIGWFLYATT